MGSRTSSLTSDMNADILDAINQRVAKSKVVIYSKTYCPYCTMAKEVFHKLGQEFDLMELDQVSNGNQIQDALEKITGARSVPRVFVNGQCIGGGTDTQSLYKQGKLQNMLK